MPSRVRRRSFRAPRRSLCSHQLRLSSRVSPVTVRAFVSSSPARRRCSITSGTPPARNTCTVAKLFGPFGRASTSRGTSRLTAAQSAAAGRRRPAAWATAGTCSSRLVDPPKAACSTMALRMAASVNTSLVPTPSCTIRNIARAERAAASSQTDWPDGANALCGSDSPSASPTTCDVAAVPRNWQPPPGVAQAAATHLGGVLKADLILRKARADGLHLARIFTVLRQQRDTAGNQNARQRSRGSERHHHRRQAFVAGRHAHHALASGKRSHQPSKNNGGIVAIGQRVQHSGRTLRASIARVGAGARKWDCTQVAQFPRGLGHQQTNLPVAGMKSQRDWRSIGRAQTTVRAQD